MSPADPEAPAPGDPGSGAEEPPRGDRQDESVASAPGTRRGEERDFGTGGGHADGHEYRFRPVGAGGAPGERGSRLTGRPHRPGRAQAPREGRPTRDTLPAHFHFLGMTDSAGQAWEGRHFTRDRVYAEDDGAAPEALARVLNDFHRGRAPASEVVETIRTARLLIPLIAQLRRAGTNDLGMAVDKANELAIVLVRAPDGRTVLPAFSSAEAMRSWDPEARAMPAAGPRVALAAASEHADLLVLDPGAPTEFAVRRPALWALAQGEPWRPPHTDPEVLRAFHRSVEGDPVVRDIGLADGDPRARLRTPEVIVELTLMPGLTKPQLDAGVAALTERWALDEVIGARVDSMSVQISRVA